MALALGVLGALLLGLAAPASASAPAPAAADRARASAAVDAMMGWYEPSTGRFDSQAAWWQSGNALQALADYMVKTRDRRLLPQAERAIELQRAPLPWYPQGNGDFRADSTDDTGWWALALVRMYDLTKKREYLDIAREDEAFMRSFRDDHCGGGIWWDAGRTYKNAISNELYLKLTASLHNRIPGDTFYLAQAQREWSWFRASGMINGRHLVNDGLTQHADGSCTNNGGTTWTYNQGVLLGGLAELHRATGDAALLRTARATADTVLADPSFTPGGVLAEPCEAAGSCNGDQAAFKGIFARNLGELDSALPGRPYRAWLRSQADAAYARDRAPGGDRYGLHWAGPFDSADIARQESAVSLLVSVLPGR
ncbi:glycosyl hydrolase [Mangrovactinospora gilvigrisea]|uniref:Glycosyl hydrolase n=1 Tax=Mangrovactinospora gilvigrisea TaxID=1428644 RepID=A0A1J7C1K4_9ACTN|nr:glycosyl hydrolase [Mangrovactinospora gilvigrisea]